MAENTAVVRKKYEHVSSNDTSYCTLEDLQHFTVSEMQIKKEDSISCGSSDYEEMQTELDDDIKANFTDNEHVLGIKTEVTSDYESFPAEIDDMKDFMHVIKYEPGAEPVDTGFGSLRLNNRLDEIYQSERIGKKQPKWSSGIENENTIESTNHLSKRFRKKKEASVPMAMTNQTQLNCKKVSSKLNDIEPIPVPKVLSVRRVRRNRIRYKNHNCSFCSKMFVDKRNRSDHENTHTGKRPHQCEICSKTFAAYAALKRHINTHTGDRRHQCSVCKQQFSQKTLLDIHTREQHLPDSDPRRYFPCNQCDTKLKTYGQMIHHKRKHRVNLPIFVCDYCQKQFTSKPSLIKHMAIHSGQMLFKCDLCFQTFERRNDKNKHVKICTNK